MLFFIFGMYYGPFRYMLTFEGDTEIPEDYEPEEIVKPLTVKTVTYDGLGNAADTE